MFHLQPAKQLVSRSVEKYTFKVQFRGASSSNNKNNVKYMQIRPLSKTYGGKDGGQKTGEENNWNS